MVGDSNLGSSGRRRFLKYTGASLAGVGLAGCTGGGGGGDGGDGTTAADTTTDEPMETTTAAETTGSAPELTDWVIGGSTEGSPANAWVQGFASTLDEYSDTLRLSPVFVNGWVASSVQLNDGELDLSMSYMFLTQLQREGKGPYAPDGPVGQLDKDIVSLLPTVHSSTSIIATASDRDDINTIDDLDGKRVGVFVRGSPITDLILNMFDTAGIQPQLSFESMAGLGEQLRNDRVDAGHVVIINRSLLPAPLAQAASSVDLKGVTIPEELQTATSDAHPHIVFETVNNEDLNQPLSDFESGDGIYASSTVATTADKDPDLVYEFVSQVIDNQAELGQYHGALNTFGFGEDRRGFIGATDNVPWHESAIRYFEENDIDYPQ